MRLARTLTTAAVALALGAAAAIAAGDRKAGNPDLSRKFKEADRNNDGKLSRVEYRATMPGAGTGSSRPSDQPAKP